MKSIREEIGNHWRVYREKAGMTQREVADELGYTTPQFISNVERGRCRYPIEKLPRIKKLYGLGTEQLVELILREERQTILKQLKKTGARA